MPIYEYACLKCSNHFEVMQKFDDKPIRKCGECGGKVEKQWSQTSMQFKGTGWYVTDYAGRKGGESKSNDDAKQEGAKADGDKSSETKSNTDKSSGDKLSTDKAGVNPSTKSDAKTDAKTIPTANAKG